MKYIEKLNYTADVDKKKNAIKWVNMILDPKGDGIPHHNVAVHLSDQELADIGQKVVREYDLDEESRSEWKELNKEAMRLAKLILEPKNDPWPGASSVKYPLITVAAIQFASRAYPEIVKGDQPVKYMVVGKDPDNAKKERGQRISQHMSYQLRFEMQDWEVDFDRLLHVLPVTGLAFKKTYFDPIDKINVSQLCLPDDVVIHYGAENMKSVRRITHLVNYYQNDIYERIASGKWLDVELMVSSDEEKPDESDVVNLFLEQHRFLDLDGDGYAEPYIVTVHKESAKVVRIIPRFEKKNIKTNDKGELVKIIPSQYFTKYGFIPALDGSIYDIGFGSLLYPLNEAINSTINRLLDAGTLSNMQSGWIDRSIRQKTGVASFKPGEWKKTETSSLQGNLRDKILPLPTKEPSNVLFLMLGLLIEAGKEISSVKDIMTGSSPGANIPATTILAMIEQGLKVFGAIYKRVYRSFGQELKQLYNLNSIYLEERAYFTVLDADESTAIARKDYNREDLDVMPTADPSISTEIQRLAKAQFLNETVSGRPRVNEDEITSRMIHAADVPDPEKLMLPEQEPVPDPKLVIEQGKLQLKAQENEIKEMELELEALVKIAQIDEIAAKITKLQADAVKAFADAEAAEAGPQLQVYLSEVKGFYDSVKEQIKVAGQREQRRQGDKVNGNNQAGSTGMEGTPSQQGSS